MADEIRSTGRLRVVKGNLTLDESYTDLLDTLTGDDFDAKTIAVPTTAAGTQISIESAVATPGYALFRNLDSTNYVELGRQVSGTFYPLIRINAGKAAGPMRLACSITELYARANTATVTMKMLILEV